MTDALMGGRSCAASTENLQRSKATVLSKAALNIPSCPPCRELFKKYKALALEAVLNGRCCTFRMSSETLAKLRQKARYSGDL